MRKTRSNKTIKNRTKRRSVKNTYNQDSIVLMFLQMLNTVKLYHWKTRSYAEHKATDELYTNLNTNIDSFVEVMLGKTQDRVNLVSTKSLPLNDYNSVSDFKKEVEKYKDFLINMTNDIGLNITNNNDLLNIRDEILGNLNQFSYLLTFNK